MWCGTTVPVESLKEKKWSIVDLTVRSAPRNCDLGFTGVYFFYFVLGLVLFFYGTVRSPNQKFHPIQVLSIPFAFLTLGKGTSKAECGELSLRWLHVMAGPSAQVICTSDVVIKVELCTGSLSLSLNLWYMTSWLCMFVVELSSHHP